MLPHHIRDAPDMGRWGPADEIAYIDGLVLRGQWQTLANYARIVMSDMRRWDIRPSSVGLVKEHLRRVMRGRVL